MPRKGNTIQVMEDTSIERLVARGISKVASLVPPWIVAVLAVIAAGVFHHMWGRPAAVPWAASGLTTGTMILTGLTWLVSHERRGPVGRIHTTLTTLLSGAWVTAATITGPLAPVTGSMAVLGGVVLALSWNIRHVIRQHDGESGHRDALAELFGRSHETHGLTARTKQVGEHKIEGQIELPAGEKTADDVAKKTEYIEGAMGLPPGTLSVAADQDRADHARLTVSDPRVMKRPILWPGPSRPGRSIAEPIRPGLWQDLDPVQYIIIGHHVQVMGMTGSAKSFGACWNYLGEVITRFDAAVFGADITKGEQTLGALRPALHRFETTKAGVKSMLGDLHGEVKGRTDYLSGRGLTKWKPGCGLLYWIVWLEECPDILDVVDTDRFGSTVKAIRSAGGTIVLSLQRSDYTQMPTIVRGQLAKWCFGVADADDADFGLTDLQAKRGARPELWQNEQPGMSYLDAPTIPDERKAMPMRAYAWGERDEDYIPNMRAYAANYPATAKAADEFTLRVMTPGGAAAGLPAAAARGAVLLTSVPPAVHHDTGHHDIEERDPQEHEEHDVDDDTGRDDDDVRSAPAEYLRTDDPNPDNQAGPDDDIDDSGYGEWEEFNPPPPPEVKLDAAQARAALLELIGQWAAEGRQWFASRDLQPFLERIDRSRQWAQLQYHDLIEAGVIGEYDERTGGYEILRRTEAA